MTQEELVAEATAFLQAEAATAGLTDEELESRGISLRTILRWEAGKGGRYDPDQVRAVFSVLRLDIREALVALGYATRSELGMPPQSPRIFNPTTEEVIAMLEDPGVPEAEKQLLVEFLRFRRQHRPGPRRAAG